MKTRFGSLVVVLAALLPTGCKMCCPSYDYCSPTNPGASQSEMCGKERRGSVFSGYTYAGGAVAPGEQIVPEGTTIESPAPPIPQQEAEPAPTARPTNYSNASARRTR